jgi:hypothetical protein
MLLFLDESDEFEALNDALAWVSDHPLRHVILAVRFGALTKEFAR